MSNERLEAEVKRKEVKAAGYEACDSYWLIVVVEAMDPTQEAEIRVDESVTASNVSKKSSSFTHLVLCDTAHGLGTDDFHLISAQCSGIYEPALDLLLRLDRNRKCRQIYPPCVNDDVHGS